MKRSTILFILLWVLLPAFSQQPDETQKKLLAFFKNIAEYDSKCSQEKVYLHLDNNGYFISETIYFKAYVVRASTLKPTDLSKVLYVELLDEDGNMITRKNYEIIDGQAAGSLSLDGLMRSGFYEVRAFTRAMLNWDGDYCFSRLIPVYETRDTTGTFSQPFIAERVYSPDIPRPRKEPAALRGDSAQHDKFYVELYPEGGARVEGLEQQVAFRVTDKKGLPAEAICRIYDAAGNRISSTQTEHEGMGSFFLPTQSTGYRITFDNGDGKERDFRLPGVRKSGITAEVTESDDTLNLRMNATSDLAGKLAGISITCRGGACHFDTLRLETTQTWKTSRQMLHYGINQITVFDENGEILWERLIWKKPQWPVSLTVKQNSTAYSPFSPIVLDMKLADEKGNPCNAYFSLAVHDIASECNGTDISANADLLLASDIKGYISQPEYYFENDDRQHRHALDLLLMIQGWRRYDWKEMAGCKPFKLVQPVEDGQLLYGSLNYNRDKQKPVKGARLDVNIYFSGNKISGSCLSDTNGVFALMPPKYYGEGIGRFRTYVGDKEKSMRIMLDRNFAPPLRTFNPREFDTYPYIHKEQPQKSTFVWQDTIVKGDIRLKGAVVKGKRKDNTTRGRRYWMGGEAFSRRNCDIYYNIPYENMRYCDTGEETPLIWDLLRTLNDKFDYTRNDDGSFKFTYKNWSAHIFIENQDQDDSDHRQNHVIFADEVESVYISTRQETLNKMHGFQSTSANPVYAIFVYLSDREPLLEDKGKSKVIRFFGYSVDEDFPSPDYRKRELPDKKDFRRTLYWNPDVLANKDGKASVVFYSNSLPDVKLGITARAVLPDGSLLDFYR